MKKLLSYLFLAVILSASAVPAAKADTFFQLPIVPDTMEFNNRINYLVTHYWDFCDLKKAFSSKQRMADAFKEYLDLMPLASGRVALESVKNFVGKIEKQPQDLLFITRQAEDYMYSDTAVVVSDQLYLPFVKAVAQNKKIDKESKMRYERQARLIGSCLFGSVAPDFKYTDRHGNLRQFSTDTATLVLLYVYDIDCPDCSLTRVRLDADASTTKLIDAGRLKIVAISSTTPDGEWRDAVASYPANWSVGAVDDFDDIYELKSVPTFYILDNKHRIIGKNLDIEKVLQVNRELAVRTPDPHIRKYRQTESTDSKE